MVFEHIPADVASSRRESFVENYRALTRNTGKLFIFAADQKIEHLNDDFYGDGVDLQTNDPRHIFEIAKQGHVGALATQFGLITRYGAQYPMINYLVKLNSKTNLIPLDVQDPVSLQLWSVADVVALKTNSNLAIRGVAYTVYLGSKHESTMLAQAAQMITQAHQHGLIALLWIYPRGKSINKTSEQLFVDAAGVAHALGADFVKLSLGRHSSFDHLKLAAQAAGNTKIICAGGSKIDTQELLNDIRDQMGNGAAGVAIGRNIFQRSRDEAILLSKAIAELVYQ